MCENKSHSKPAVLNRAITHRTNKMICAANEDSNQPGHSPSVIRGFAVSHRTLGPKLTKQMHSEDSDQTGCACPFVVLSSSALKTCIRTRKKVAANLPHPLFKKCFFVHVVCHSSFTNRKQILWFLSVLLPCPPSLLHAYILNSFEGNKPKPFLRCRLGDYMLPTVIDR